MRENHRIGREVGKHEQGGAADGSAGPQVLFVGMEADEGGSGRHRLHRDVVSVRLDLRKDLIDVG